MPRRETEYEVLDPERVSPSLLAAYCTPTYAARTSSGTVLRTRCR
jgi:hypothetical protein